MEKKENSNDDIVDLGEIDALLSSSKCEMEQDTKPLILISEDENNEILETKMVEDEWNDCGMESEDDEEARKRDMSYINPEDVERAILNMPTIKQLSDDMVHLKHGRKLTAAPLNIIDLTDSHIVELISWNTLSEFNTSFVRSAHNPEVLTGITSMAFTTCKSASTAVDHLKAWRSDLDVKIDMHTHQTTDSFTDKNGLKKKWTDNVAVLKNLSNEVTEEAIRDLFANVEDVVLHLDTRQGKKTAKNTPVKGASDSVNSDSHTITPAVSTDNVTDMDTATATEPLVAAEAAAASGGAVVDDAVAVAGHQEQQKPVVVLPSAPPKGYAYLVFGTEEVMRAEVEAAVERRLELCGHKLMLLAYKAPVHAIPRSYLRLRERKALLMYVERCNAKIEVFQQNADQKVPLILEEKVALSRAALAHDNSCRIDLGLPQPSLEELSSMNGLPRLNSALIQKTLTRYGIIVDKKKEAEVVASPEVKRFRGNSNNSYRGGGGGGGGRRNNHNSNYSPSRNGRRSPYNKRNHNHRKPYGGGYYHSAGRSGGHGGGGGRRNTSLLGNAALANPLAQLVMQQNLLGLGGGGGYGGGAPMDGLLGNPYTRGIDSQGQLLRLDETGNFRPDSEARYPALNHPHYDDSGRHNDYRRRSRSPVGGYGMRDHSSSGSGVGAAVGMGALSGAGGVVGAGGDDSVNLLLNLSQMLSNKMDQKRQQLEQDKRMNFGRRYDDY